MSSRSAAIEDILLQMRVHETRPTKDEFDDAMHVRFHRFLTLLEHLVVVDHHFL